MPIVGIILGLIDPQQFEAAKVYWQDKLLVFGAGAMIAFVALQALQVIITPISHYSIGVVGGFLYGPYLGGLLNWIGRVIGHTIAFFLGRNVGRGIAERYAKGSLEKYDKYVSGRSWVLFVLFYLPFFPDDELSYLAGLSKMELRQYLFANIFGQVGGAFGLAYIGSGAVSAKDPIFWILSATCIACFVILWFTRRKRFQ